MSRQRGGQPSAVLSQRDCSTLIGGIVILIYEAAAWAGAQNLMPLAGIPRNATGLVFGRQIQESLGGIACLVGTGIHFLFSIAWPYFRERGYEATFLALIHAVIALIVIHAAIMSPPTVTRTISILW